MNYPNLKVLEAQVEDIIIKPVLSNGEDFSGREFGEVKGVILLDGRVLKVKVVVTTGTFLGGEIHIRLKCSPQVEWEKMPHLDYLKL